MNKFRLPNKRRTGISLLEVIACTSLLTILIIPLADVIRASRKSIAYAHGTPNTSHQLRRAIDWIDSTVRDGQIMTIEPEQLLVMMSSGQQVRIHLSGTDLMLTVGSQSNPIVSGITGISFQEIIGVGLVRIGTVITLRAYDPDRNATATVTTNIADSIHY